MGLFNFLKKKDKPAELDPNMLLNYSTTANLTEKAVKVAVADDEEGTLIKGVYIWEEENLIRGLVGDKVIFEVNKRSKAFEEIKPWARKKADSIVLQERQSEYGTYYRLRLRRKITLAEWEEMKKRYGIDSDSEIDSDP